MKTAETAGPDPVRVPWAPGLTAWLPLLLPHEVPTIPSPRCSDLQSPQLRTPGMWPGLCMNMGFSEAGQDSYHRRHFPKRPGSHTPRF